MRGDFDAESVLLTLGSMLKKSDVVDVLSKVAKETGSAERGVQLFCAAAEGGGDEPQVAAAAAGSPPRKVRKEERPAAAIIGMVLHSTVGRDQRECLQGCTPTRIERMRAAARVPDEMQRSDDADANARVPRCALSAQLGTPSCHPAGTSTPLERTRDWLVRTCEDLVAPCCVAIERHTNSLYVCGIFMMRARNKLLKLLHLSVV